MTVIGILVTAVGVSLGLWLWLLGRPHRTWLAARVWTERLRQLYFQFVLSHLELAVRAMSNDDDLFLYHAKQQKSLQGLKERLANAERHRQSPLDEDKLEDNGWIEPSWRQARLPSFAPNSNETVALEQLIDRLGMQRIEAQILYAGAARAESPYSLVTRDRVLSAVLNLSSLMLPFIAIWTGIAVWYEANADLPLAVVAAVGAVGLTARMLDQGLRARFDAERYAWYGAAVLACQRAFNDGGVPQKFSALQTLETHAYCELRGFVTTHHADKFIV